MADFYELDDVIDTSKPLMEQINLHCRQLIQLKNEMDRTKPFMQIKNTSIHTILKSVCTYKDI